MKDKIKILYIVGRGRSGSTLLDSILGQTEGFFSVGELRSICKVGLVENRQCGCGAVFSECEIWKEVLSDAFGCVPSPAGTRELIHLLDSRPKHPQIPLFLLPWREAISRYLYSDYLISLEKLYHGICRKTGSRVIVDSSKSPPYGYLLSLIPSFEVYFVHLIRDPRAVAYSWVRKQRQPQGFKIKYMRRESAVRSSFIWNLWNIMAEMHWSNSPDKYLMIRYEDLIDKPAQTLQAIVSLAGESNARLPLTGEKTLQLAKNHMVSGNPSRFKTGTVELRANNSWKKEFSRSNVKLVTALCWPLLRKYGYVD